MLLFKYPKDLSDVVSIIFYCQDKKSFFLIKEANGEFKLPSSLVVNKQWKESALELALELFGFELAVDAVKIYKIWIPNNVQPFIYHIVYRGLISSTPKKGRSKKSRETIWIDSSELERIRDQGRFKSPEIYTLISMVNTTITPSVELKELRDANLQNYQTDKNFITEIFENDIIVSDKNIYSGYKELLKSATFEKSDQNLFYSEFLVVCFPYFYMSCGTFSGILTTIFGFKHSDALNLFRSADIHRRSALSFRDFLYIFAACNSVTTHIGSTAEIRSRYIFRFFDQNNDGVLEYSEFKNMIKYIQNSKTHDANVGKDTNSYITVLGISPEDSIPIGMFLSAVAELKIRGTSLILRFLKNVKDVLRAQSFNIFISEQERRKPFLERYLSAPSKIIIGSTNHFDKQNDPELAVHTVKLKQYGSLIDVDELWTMNEWVTPSTIKPLQKSINRASIDAFNQKSPANEVIQLLKYFTQSYETYHHQPGKEAFSWGQTNLKSFGENLIKICEKVKNNLKEEPRMLELASPIYVIGDIHGNFSDLMYFERVLWPLSPTLIASSILFLGDYVDRGICGVEVVAYLFAYKLQTPKKIFLLRGNHEIRDVQKNYSFYSECIEKFGDKLGNQVWTSINLVFDNMPIAAIIDNKIFCCHGGIPPPWLCPEISMINSIPIPLPLPEEQSQLAWNMLWNDPIKQSFITGSVQKELNEKEGFAYNSRRGTGYMFTSQALGTFLQTHGFTHMIRAHESKPAGISIQFSGKLLTVFSSSRYCGGTNEAACVLCDSGKIRVLRMETT